MILRPACSLDASDDGYTADDKYSRSRCMCVEGKQVVAVVVNMH